MGHFIPGRPGPDESGPYTARYAALVPEDDVVAVLDEQVGEPRALLGTLSDEVGRTRHPPYTWSVKQVVGHLTDSERIFTYRALRFARADATPLPGYDDNHYVAHAPFDEVALPELLAEWEAARRSHVLFFRALDETAWARGGVANSVPITVRALAYAIAGHARHHLAILRARLAGG